MAQGSSILLLRSAPAPRGNAAMPISFAALLTQCGVPNARGLTESSPVGAWSFLFNRKSSVINFDALSTTGWDYPGCSGGCGSSSCNNNFCTAQGGVPRVL